MPVPRSQDFDVLLGGIKRDLAAEFGCDTDALPEIGPEIMKALKRGFQRKGMSARSLASLVRRSLEMVVELEARQTVH